MHSASLTPLALFPILLPNAQAQGEWQVSGGATVNLFAESPGLFNPTAIDVDDAGRVWVAEGSTIVSGTAETPVATTTAAIAS
ncbi:MAG: hypothetical protein R3F17_11295 [Planctomycetota bacterium]